jgi:hypothetical protein
LGWLVEHKGIEPHVPVWDKSERMDGTFAIGAFIWDEQANEYRCPGGYVLRSQWRVFTNPRSHITKAGTIIYHASQRDCQQCSLKAQCCPNMPNRKIARSIHEDARDAARHITDTPEYWQSGPSTDVRTERLINNRVLSPVDDLPILVRRKALDGA